MKLYSVNEIFRSIQGEGHRAGTSNVFVRFAGCNLTCSRDGEAGFDCDTEFVSNTKMTSEQIIGEIQRQCAHLLPSVILTGGEPLLQVDTELLERLFHEGAKVAIETNGTRPLPAHPVVDMQCPWLWVSCSPKTAEHTLRLQTCDELRYVRHVGQAIPKPSLAAKHLFLSPAWSDDPAERAANLKHCIALVNANPEWRLSRQQHKDMLIR